MSSMFDKQSACSVVPNAEIFSGSSDTSYVQRLCKMVQSVQLIKVNGTVKAMFGYFRSGLE
jgi:hypothetical protein